jgi:symplekin
VPHFNFHRIKLLEKRTRGAAINTVKPWVPHQQPMDAMIREFALQMLRKLQLRSPQVHYVRDTDGDIMMNGHGNGSSSVSDGAEEEDIAKNVISSEKRGENGEKEQSHDMAADQLPQDDLVQTPYLPERIELPAQKQQVLQHVELLFALSVKVPDFLDQ